MRIKPQFIFLVAALAPLIMFFLPIWQIQLAAPQFPDPIRMYIWINQITGGTEGTLQNVNILNHYVGMAKIKPDMFPEFKIFPWVVGGMSALGVILAFFRKKVLYLTYGIVWMILGAIGIYDFYRWEYEYGHNLDPTAPITIPGQTYQPPLLGGKTILNFEAFSFPYWGSLGIGLAIILALLAYWLDRKRAKN